MIFGNDILSEGLITSIFCIRSFASFDI
jgi:hypothetical protein